MIVPRKAIIRNFLSIQEADLTLGNQGLVLIEGVNQDDPSANSNGSGKSSIVDAISWCLFGETARGATGDSVVNLKAGKGTFVEMEVEIDGDTYTIMRGRKHPTLKNRVRLQRGSHDLTLGTDKLTQERINTLLGCGPETFNAAIYMGQERMADLPSMTDKALKAVLEEALSLDKLDHALDIVNKRIDMAEEALTKSEAKLRYYEVTMDNADKEQHRTQDMIKSLKDDIGFIKDSMQIDQLRLEVDLKENEEEIKRWEAKLSDTEDCEKIKTDMEWTLAKTNKPLRDRLAQEYERAGTAKATMERCKRDAQQLKDQPTECHACHRAFDDAHDHTDEIEKLEKAIVVARADWHKASENIGKLEKAIKDNQQKHNADLAVALSTIFDRSTVENQLIKLKVKQRAIQDDHQKAFDRVASALNDKTNRIKLLEQEIEDLIDKGLAAKNAMDVHQQVVNDNRDYLETLGRVKYALGRKGFRGEVLDQVTPYLNTRTQHYLEAMTDGNIEATWSTITQNSAGDYVEDFHIEVRHQSGVDRFQLLSGGEKRKVRLACALALQDLVATRAVKPIRLFIADEIDDAIDESGLELLMGVLEAKAKDVGSVFVISHNDLGDWCRNKITVVKHAGVSTFKQPSKP